MKKKNKTQAERVLDYIKQHGSISSAEAFTELSVMDLPKRICELKDMGCLFSTKTVRGKNKFGDKVHWNVYRLVKENGDD